MLRFIEKNIFTIRHSSLPLVPRSKRRQKVAAPKKRAVQKNTNSNVEKLIILTNGKIVTFSENIAERREMICLTCCCLLVMEDDLPDN